MATFEGELEISFSSGPLSPSSAVAPDGPESGGGENASSSSSTSSFLSNLFDPSIVDPSYTTSTDVPKFAPPSVILIEEIENDDRNGTIQIIDENDGGGTDEIERVRYEHDVYFVLVVVTVSLTVLVMVTFAIYRIVENVMDGGGGGGRGRRGGRGEGRRASAPAGSAPAPVGTRPAATAAVAGSPQGHVGRAHSVEFLSGEVFSFGIDEIPLSLSQSQVRCIDRTDRKSVRLIALPAPTVPLSPFGRCRRFGGTATFCHESRENAGVLLRIDIYVVLPPSIVCTVNFLYLHIFRQM